VEQVQQFGTEFLLVFGIGLSLLLVMLFTEIRCGQKIDPSLQPSRSEPKWALAALLGISLLLGLARIPFALQRLGRNVDEFDYAARAAFILDSGESVFTLPGRYRLHTALYLFGGDSPFAFVDTITSLITGVTAFLLGWTVYKVTRRIGPAILTLLSYVLGLIPFEGLSSNAEPYVNFCLALYLFIRFASRAEQGQIGKLRRVSAGAALGLAFVMKEHAITFILIEPAVEIIEMVYRRAKDGVIKTFLVHQALAAAGFWIPLGLYLMGYAMNGRLGVYFHGLVAFGMAGGSTERAGSWSIGIESLQRLVEGLFPLWSRPYGYFSLACLLSLIFQSGKRARQDFPFVGSLAFMSLIAVCTISIGYRFFSAYFILAAVPMAPLMGIRIMDAIHEVKSSNVRTPIAIFLIVGALITLDSAAAIWSGSVRIDGQSMDMLTEAKVKQISRIVRESTPEDEPILVWGWRQEVYYYSQRVPACSFTGGWVPDIEKIIPELDKRMPSAVVFPGSRGSNASMGKDVYEIKNFPLLRRWLEDNRFRLLVGAEGEFHVYIRDTRPIKDQ